MSQLFHAFEEPDDVFEQLTGYPVELLGFADRSYRLSKDGTITLHGASDMDASVHKPPGEDDMEKEDSLENRSADEEKDIQPPEVKQTKAADEKLENNSSMDLSLYSFFLRPAGWPAIFGWVFYIMVASVGEWAPGLCSNLYLLI